MKDVSPDFTNAPGYFDSTELSVRDDSWDTQSTSRLYRVHIASLDVTALAVTGSDLRSNRRDAASTRQETLSVPSFCVPHRRCRSYKYHTQSQPIKFQGPELQEPSIPYDAVYEKPMQIARMVI